MALNLNKNDKDNNESSSSKKKSLNLSKSESLPKNKINLSKDEIDTADPQASPQEQFEEKKKSIFICSKFSKLFQPEKLTFLCRF